MSIEPNIAAKAEAKRNEPAPDAPMRKFMFDRSFDDIALAQRPAEQKPVLMKPEQIDALKKEARDRGFAEGKEAGKEEQATQLAAIMTTVGKNIDTLMQNIDALRHEQEAHTRQLVMAIAKKILPDFAARQGLQEIEALLGDAVRDMGREPRLVVRVNEAHLDAVKAQVEKITAQRAYTGTVVVLSDAEVAAGDCRIEWADGGIERNTQATWDAVEQTVLPSS